MNRVIHQACVVLLGLALLVSSGAAAVQENAPSLLEDLGLPVLEVTVTSDGIDAPAEVAAGPVLFVAHNETDEIVTSSLSQLPDGITDEEYAEALGAGTLPEWVAGATVVGGFDQEPGSQASAVLNLAPGEWKLGVSGDTPGALPIVTVTATGEAPEGAADAIPADSVITMNGHAFEFPDTITAGPQIWRVTNEDEGILHHIVVFPSDALYTTDELMPNLTATFMGTPVAEGFDLTAAPPVMATSAISGGQSIWVDVNLDPGYYVALCFISDPGSDVPHIMQRMIATFEVTEGA